MWSPKQTQSNRLEIARLALTEARDMEIATIIAEETERERERVRAEFPDKGVRHKNEKPALGLLGNALAHIHYSYADSMTWDALLMRSTCGSAAAKRAGISRLQLIQFALDKCQPADFNGLFWFGEWLKTQGEVMNLEIQNALQARLAEKFRASQAGAIKGGRKSAEARRQKPPVITFTNANLLAEYDRLLRAGKEQKDIAGIIAESHGWKVDSVRKRLRVAKKTVT